MDISDFSERDEIEAGITYEKCATCGNMYAASILTFCPICERKKPFQARTCGCDCHECWAGIHHWSERREGVCNP